MSGPDQLRRAGEAELPPFSARIFSTVEDFPAQNWDGHREGRQGARHIPYGLPAAAGPIEATGRRRDEARLLVSSRFDGTDTDTTFAALGDFLDPGDVLVVNTSATLPAAIPTGDSLLLHLASELPGGLRLPGSSEMPSAARGFTAELVTRLVAKGIVFAPITLHCGVSSPEAGEGPQPERYRVPAPTAAVINGARDAGHLIVAVGTTATRALETTAGLDGTVHPGEGWTELVITPERGVRAIDGLITGWHEPEASHLDLIEAVAGRATLERAYARAGDLGYHGHEFGDFHLIVP